MTGYYAFWLLHPMIMAPRQHILSNGMAGHQHFRTPRGDNIEITTLMTAVTDVFDHLVFHTSVSGCIKVPNAYVDFTMNEN